MVTGAAGQIAYSFLPLLCSGQIFGNDAIINLRLLGINYLITNLDIPQSEKILKGVVLEIQDSNFSNFSLDYYGSDAKWAFQDVDIAIFLGGFPRLKGMERKDLIHKNSAIFEEMGKSLNNYAKTTCN